MNDLSILLYLADVLPSLGTACTLIVCFGFFGWVMLTVVSEGFMLENDEVILVPHKKIASLLAVIGLLAVFTPSKDTIYLIAASEMGEEVLKTEAAEKVRDYLDLLLTPQE